MLAKRTGSIRFNGLETINLAARQIARAGIAIVPELSWHGQFSQEIGLKNIGENKRNIYVYKKHSVNGPVQEFFTMLIEKFSS